MKKFVFTIMDDVCAANCKDVEATELLEKMRLWGTVEPFENVLAGTKSEFQKVIDNLTAQLNAIKEQELTEDEILFLNFYRERIVANSAEFMRRIGNLEKHLEDIVEGYQKKIAQVSALLTEA